MAKPNDLAACQATVGSDWILAKVIHHDPASGMYKLSDEDVESNKSKYRVILATMHVFCRILRLAVYRGLLLLTLPVWCVPPIQSFAQSLIYQIHRSLSLATLTR
jgi:hypothetical protein